MILDPAGTRCDRLGITTFALPTHHNDPSRPSPESAEAAAEGAAGSAPAGTAARKRGHAVLRIHERERDRLVVQLGTSVGSVGAALRAANLVLAHGDCAGIDINMGCPKHFAMQGGMGAALLRDCDGAVGLMRTMREGIPEHVPLSCKVLSDI